MVISYLKLNLPSLIQRHPMKNSTIKTDSHKLLTPAMEDYLEAIFNLSREKRVVRVKDIAKRLGVKMPTVTSMLKTLSERGLVDYEKYEYLELTQKGSAVGEEIDRRHHVLGSFLTNILRIDFEKVHEEVYKEVYGIYSILREGGVRLPRINEYRVCGKEPDKYLGRRKNLQMDSGSG